MEVVCERTKSSRTKKRDDARGCDDTDACLSRFPGDIA